MWIISSFWRHDRHDPAALPAEDAIAMPHLIIFTLLLVLGMMASCIMM
ncbi:hypothetical protein GCM10011505_10760 [Tistrella bauzanensis]|uniref:Uncharacterized protein n=1 Tax=Tistrella bauzanensis TaxID=657419 RepID=A0ABQ1I9Z0_9PROT|nr:hypothetical protein [Tistrella bauzanensis]GGB31216.1 hypothetical protein GCM10011505_10760 [Tistrella bauzanensis]